MAYFRSGLRQAPSTILGWPASPSLPDQKTLILGATLILLATLRTEIFNQNREYLTTKSQKTEKNFIATPGRQNPPHFSSQT
jgi:hypothetical protein